METQCYVVAAGQCGTHNAKRSSYGHSMIIDPWGTILAHVEEDKPGYATATIDFDYLKQVRNRLPVWTDRKPELYGFIQPAQAEYLQKDQFEDFAFGNTALVKSYQVFAKTQFSIGFLNHRPVLPGHVLVAPLRSGAYRLSDLTDAEVYDMFKLAKRVQQAVEKIHGATSSTVAIQDGPEAGQSIEHLHVHILPRKSTDFGGKVDEIYERLRQHDKKSNPFNIPLLTEAEMTELSNVLKKNM